MGANIFHRGFGEAMLDFAMSFNRASPAASTRLLTCSLQRLDLTHFLESDPHHGRDEVPEEGPDGGRHYGCDIELVSQFVGSDRAGQHAITVEVGLDVPVRKSERANGNTNVLKNHKIPVLSCLPPIVSLR